MALPCIHYWFSSSLRANHVQFHWNPRNISGELKGLDLELLATSDVQLHGDTVTLFRGRASRYLRKNKGFHVAIPLDPIRQRQWDYFWPRVRVVSGQRHCPDVMLLNGHGNEPIYVNGSFPTPSTLHEIDPGPWFCPECGVMFEPSEAFFGNSPDKYIVPTESLRFDGVLITTGRRGKKRMRWCAVDAAKNTYTYIFCPEKHLVPQEIGLFDRLVVGILGREFSVVRYLQDWNKLLAQSTNGVFAQTAQDARESQGGQGSLMLLHPVGNDFPVYLWLYKFCKGEHSASDYWDFAEYMNGLVLLVNPLMPGKPAELLSEFWEEMDADVGTKLPVSLAIVLTDCESLIGKGVFPQNMAWNLPDVSGGKFNPLVHCDTSARVGEYVARTFPKLHRLAKDRFSSVAFFGTCSADPHTNGQLMHRCEDPLMWMLAERKQIPTLKQRKALHRISSHQCDKYVFNTFR